MKRNKNSLTLVVAMVALGCLAIFPPQVEGRQFTSTDGKKIEATVLKVTTESVVLESGRNNFTVPLSRLSKDDQSFLKKWAENEKKNRIPKVEIKVNSNKRDRREQNAYEDRRGEFKFEIFIENEERDFDINKATGTLIVFGKYFYERDEGIVMERKEFKDITIPDGDSMTLEGSLVKFEYDKDGYQHGRKYEGYLFVLKTAGGKVIKTMGSTSRVENSAPLILKLRNGNRFDEKTYMKVNGSAIGQ